MATKKPAAKKAAKNAQPSQLLLTGLHMTQHPRTKEFHYYGYKNGNYLTKATEGYERRESVYTMLFAQGSLFVSSADELKTLIIHDHTRKEYQRIEVTRFISGSSQGVRMRWKYIVKVLPTDA